MTFYWWSHWFWITILTIVTINCVSVYSYPSQDTSTPSLLEFKQNLSTSQNIVTKLYQQIEFSTPHQEGTTKLRSILIDSPEHTNKSSQLSLQDEDLSVEKDDIKRSIEETTEIHSKENATTEEQITHNETEPALTTPSNNYSSFEISTADTSFNSTNIEQLKNVSVEADSGEKKEEDVIQKSNWSINDSLHIQDNELKSIIAQPAEDDTDSTASAASISVTIQRAPFTLENANKLEQLRQAESEHYARKSKLLAADYQVAHTFTFPQDAKNLLTRSASVAPIELSGPRRRVGDEGNISTEALAIKRTYFLDAGTISAICLTIFGICCTIGTLGIVVYRRKYINKPQTLSEPDSSVYIDDSTMRVSDNSDEMYSLDNDSFLNSLEAMTIQNYWTDTVKHTKL